MRERLRFLLMLFLAMGVWVASAAPAGAHSVIVRSSPSSNAALPSAPGQVDLWFSEAIDPAFSSASVSDTSGTRASERTAISADGLRMTVTLANISKGLYTVRWRVLSAADGHTTSGAFVFSVGTAPPAAGAASAGTASSLDLPLAIVRWVDFLSAGLLAGTAFFVAWILGPGPLQTGRDGPDLSDRVRARLRELSIVSAVILAIFTGLELTLRAAAVLDISLAGAAASGQLGLLLWNTKIGWSTLVRLAMAALLLFPLSPRARMFQAGGLLWCVVMGAMSALFGGPGELSGSSHLALAVLVGAVYGLISVMAVIILPQIPDFRLPNLRWVPSAAAFVLLLGFTMTSHAWASGPLAVLFDWLHLIAASIWIGGLASLLLAAGTVPFAECGPLCRVLVPRVSSLAAISLGTMVVTGLYGTWLHIPGLRAFVTTDYGRALLIKLLLVIPVIGLGAANRFVLHPRLQAAGGRGTASNPMPAVRRFLRAVTGEVSLALVIVLVVAVLTNFPPARVTVASPAAPPATVRMAGVAGGFKITLTVDPALPGPNRLEVAVTGLDDKTLDSDARVLVRLTKLDEDLSPVTISLAPQGNGRYSADVGELALPGYWQTEVVLRRRGQLDASAAFPLRLGEAPASNPDPQAVRLLDQAQEATNLVHVWQEVQQLTDGFGGVDVTATQYRRPDRLRYRSLTTGDEGVIIGADRYQRAGAGPWEKEVLPRPIVVTGPTQYTKGAQAVTRGRSEPCEDDPSETCQVLLWQSPGGSASFAGWVGTRGHMIHKLLMVAPGHFMTLRMSDFNAPVQIEPPK